MEFEIRSSVSLSDIHKKELEVMKKKASKDKFLEGDEDILRGETVKKIIIVNDSVAGFYSPLATSMKGKRYWRSGAVYLDVKHRGKGLMFRVLEKFFKEHRPGVAWIDDTNTASINLFTRLGFEKFKPRDHEGTPGHWYILKS